MSSICSAKINLVTANLYALINESVSKTDRNSRNVARVKAENARLYRKALVEKPTQFVFIKIII